MSIKPQPTGRTQPSPMPHQQRTPEQIDINRKRIETPFIFLRPDADERNCSDGALGGRMIQQIITFRAVPPTLFVRAADSEQVSHFGIPLIPKPHG